MPRKSVERKSTLSDCEPSRTFVNPSAISPHLFCPICQEAFVNPQRAPCGHSFCKSCLEPWLASNPICPVDRKPVSKQSLHHDFIIESIIGDYTVACPWRALGCDFVGPLHMLESHKKRCVMNPGSMPPALRERTTALLNKWHQKTELSSTSVAVGNSAICSVHSSGESAASTDSAIGSQPNAVVAEEEEAETLPPTPPPNLLFRLYQNSDSGSRDLLCNFLETTTSTLASEPVPKRCRTSRGGRRPPRNK